MFDFRIEPKITKEFLLSQNNQETYMSYYLGLPVKKGLFKSPLRSDRHTTCSFFKGKSGTLYFKDFATGDCLSFEGVVMKKYNCDYHKALKIIANDFGFINSSTPKVVKVQPVFKEDKQTFIQAEIKPFEPYELKWWSDFGVTQRELNKYRVFSCKTVFLNGNVFAQSTQHNPIYGYYFGKKENVEQWKIYMPKSHLRFIGNISQKVIQGYHQLPKKGSLLIITKSMKDVCAFSRLGIPAIAPQSEVTFLPDKMIEELKTRFKFIVVMFDNDLPGISNLNKIRKKFPEFMYYWIPRKYGSKDFTDFIRDHGLEAAKDLIKKSIENGIAKYKSNRNV